MMKTVLIMGNDDHAFKVNEELQLRGQSTFMFDSRGDWTIQGVNESLVFCGLNFDDIKSFYWRSHDGVRDDVFEVKYNRDAMFNSWLKSIYNSRIPCYNGYLGWDLHRTKPYQMMKARRYLNPWSDNVKIPDTYWGYTESGAVAKGCQGGFHAYESREDSFDDALCCQRFIKGTTIRAFVFYGRKTLCYEVKSECLDYRADQSPMISITSVPDAVSSALQKLIYVLGMNWSGVDIIFDGQVYWVLDINPSPMFLGFQRENEIMDTLCEELTR